MPRTRRRLVTSAVVLSMLLLATASATSATTRRTPGSEPDLRVPVDTSDIQFYAYGWNGWALVPGADFYLNLRRTVLVGPMHLVEIVDGNPVELGTAPWTYGGTTNGMPAFDASLLVPGTTAGPHTYQAVFDATDTLDSAVVELIVDFEPTRTFMSISVTPNPVQTNHAISLYTDLSSLPTKTAISGTIEWRDADSDAVLGTTSTAERLLTVASLPAGVHNILAVYSGDAEHLAATSDVVTLTVVSDVVEASDVGIQYTTFYPYKDSYRDTVAIKGDRGEPISVDIRIYGPTGSRVRSASIATDAGSYAYAWNGRTSAGSVLAAGKYRVVQTLTDGVGLKSTVTGYVNLSHKRLVTHTTYVTKRGSSLSASGHGGSGSVTVSTTAGYAKFRVGSSGWALGGWELSLPSATLYKAFAFQVYSKGGKSVPATVIGMQNFASCPRATGTWYDSCFDHWVSIGNQATTAWFSTSTKSGANRSGRFVRGMLSLQIASTYVYKVRLKVVSATLQ